jgi:hypothetical protein
MNKNIKYFFIAISILSLMTTNICGATTSVTASGSAAGTPANAGELALTNALREAVRKGAGVDILSESKVQNFTMEYDRVMTSSFGYIKSYQIISRKYYNKKQLYVVVIKAEVAKGSPKMDQVLALRLLVKRMKSPRVVIECSENIAGINQSGEATMAKMLLEEMAQKTGFEVFRKKAINSRNRREALRAKILGDKFEAQVKAADITSTSDFKIIAKVNGQVGSMREPFPEMKVRDVALGIDLQAVWTDTGEVVATVSLPTTYHKGESNMNLPYEMPQQLVRYYLNSMLTGHDSAFKTNNGYKLFRRIIAKWITELDLGAKIELEFRTLSKPTLDKLLLQLKANPKISYVWLREFDRRLYSVIEVETRLPSKKIEQLILKQLGGKYLIDTVTKRRLRFIPAE